MLIRPRHDDDVTQLCELVRAIHRLDGYPVLLEDDVRDFLVTTNCLAAWVCEIDGRLVGHVALHTVWSDDVAELASSSLGRARDALGSISRLFVEPSTRGAGLGAHLVAVATSAARECNLSPVLDVVTTSPAIALYERLGWTRLGTTTSRLPNGEPIDEHVYAAPGGTYDSLLDARA